MAHEINTPLGVGVTAASHLDERTREVDRVYSLGQLKRSTLEQYLKTANESSRMILENLRRASEHVQSFKQVAVDQTSEMKRRFYLKDYIDAVLLSLHPRLKRTTHSIRIECSENLMINSYPGVFSQILTNFIINSLLHGFETREGGGHILVAVSADDEVLELRYHDDGTGISPEDCPKIFDPFFTTTRGQGGGSGLGLHIVYNLVTQKLHASIECNSRHGEGASFTIRIPWDVIR